MTEWFDEQTAGVIGGAFGVIFGAGFGGIGGGVGGPLAAQGKAKGLVLGMFAVGIACGVILLGIGATALVLGQPYHVWYPFGLTGFVLTVVMGGLFPVVRLRYRQAEERKLDAESLRRS
jgi:hypothetical protein